MSDNTIYRYRDVMELDFPFKLEVRNNELLNKSRQTHEPLQICYVTKGSCLYTVCQNQAVLAKGDIFVIPPYQEHNLSALPEKEIELVQIDFMPFFINEQKKAINEMESFIDFSYIQPFIKAHGEMPPKLNVSLEKRILIENLIESMQRELREKRQKYRLSIKADLFKLLIIVGREYRDYLNGNQDKHMMKHPRILHDSIQFMKVNYQYEIKLDLMAERASMSPTYFSFVFKLTTGRNFIDYLNEIRIRKAMELLQNSCMNVTEVCLAVGYNHWGHFIRMFKRITAVTPSQYRKTDLKQVTSGK